METQERTELLLLIEEVIGELERKGYSKRTLDSNRHVWKQFITYLMNKSLPLTFSEAVGEEFLKDVHGYPYEHTGYLPYTIRTAVRGIRILGDYRLYHSITKKCSPKGIVHDQNYNNTLLEFGQYLQDKYYAESSIRRHKQKIGYFWMYLSDNGATEFKELNPKLVEGYILSLTGYAPCTIKSNFGTLRCFFRFMYVEEIVREDFIPLIPPIHNLHRMRIPNVWKKEELKTLFDSIDRGSPIGKRDYAALLLIAKLGLRNSDVSNLRFCHIDWEKKQLSFVQVKTQKRLELPLIEEVGWAIIDYMQNGRPISNLPYVFLHNQAPYDRIATFSAILQRRLQNAGIHIDPDRPHGVHTLRHALASRLLEENIPLPLISEILGHTTIHSTKDYLRIDIERLRECALNLGEVLINEEG